MIRVQALGLLTLFRVHGSAFLWSPHFSGSVHGPAALPLESPVFQPYFCTARYSVWVLANIVWVSLIHSNTIWDQPVVPHAWECSFLWSGQLLCIYSWSHLWPPSTPHTPTARLGYRLFLCALLLGGLCVSNIGFGLYYNYLFTYLSLPCHTYWSVCLLVPVQGGDF